MSGERLRTLSEISHLLPALACEGSNALYGNLLLGPNLIWMQLWLFPVCALLIQLCWPCPCLCHM